MNIDRFFSVFKTSGQALAIQRKNVQIAAENLANAQTTRASGGPYKPQKIILTKQDDNSVRKAFVDALAGSGINKTAFGSISEIGKADGPVNLAPEMEVIELERYRFEYNPSHPDADENGMVKFPDVDLIEEMTTLITANRLYEANLSAIEAEKEIIRRAFEL